MTRSATLAATLVLLLLTGASAQAQNFGPVFPDLPPLNQQTNQQLADLAQTQLDPNADADNNPAGVGSFETYFGQFVDHDLFRDECCVVPLAPVDPRTIPNARTFRFDLDSLYGGGPAGSPQLYEVDGAHMKVQNPNANGVRDLPRNPDGSAILVEGRNDENQIISQFHTAMLMLHNRVLDSEPGCGPAILDGAVTEVKPTRVCFEQARRDVTDLYQWVVVHDFLPALVGQATVDRFLQSNGKVRCEFYCQATFSPVEVSGAAYRGGHSMVRKAYELNETSGKIQVFSLTQPDLRGGRPLQAGRQIEWGNFVNALTDPNDTDGINLFRKIDTLISSGLFTIPIGPGAEAAGSNVLGFRNMLRAKSYGLPSYESVAQRMGVTPVGPPVFPEGTPLWYGILRESSAAANGQTLGPVAGRLVAETFLRSLADDKDSILNRGFKPKSPFANTKGDFTSADLLVLAGVAERG